MAREVADVKAEQRELRVLLGRRKYSAEIDGGGVAENRHPVFEKYIALPLKSIDDFKYFEEELLKPDVKANLVSNCSQIVLT